MKLALAVLAAAVLLSMIWELSPSSAPVAMSVRPSANREDAIAAPRSVLFAPGAMRTLEVEQSAVAVESRVALIPERPTAPGPVHGRVVSAATGAPRAGFRILHGRGIRKLAETATDSEGRFVLTRQARVADRLEVARRPGWRAREMRLWLTDEQAQGREPVIFRVARVEGFPVRGRVVEEGTGLPVSDYGVIVRGPSRVEQELLTDEAGWFETPDPVEAGTVKIITTPPRRRLVEGRTFDQYRSLKLEHLCNGAGAAEVEIAIDPGHCLELALPGMETIETPLFALLTDRPGSNEGLLSPVVGGARPSACFESDVRDFDRLEVRSPDGLWFGACPYVDGESRYTVVMQRTGALQVHFLDRSFFDLPPVREVEVVDMNGRRYEALFGRGANTLAYHHLTEGLYLVRHRPRTGRSTEHTVEVIRGETSAIELDSAAQE